MTLKIQEIVFIKAAHDVVVIDLKDLVEERKMPNVVQVGGSGPHFLLNDTVEITHFIQCPCFEKFRI